MLSEIDVVADLSASVCNFFSEIADVSVFDFRSVES